MRNIVVKRQLFFHDDCGLFDVGDVTTRKQFMKIITKGDNDPCRFLYHLPGHVILVSRGLFVGGSVCRLTRLSLERRRYSKSPAIEKEDSPGT
jgi:hypothetical protein